MTNHSLPPRWANVTETARYARLGRTKTWELIQSGDIFAARIGRVVRCDLNSIDALYRRNPVVPPSMTADELELGLSAASVAAPEPYAVQADPLIELCLDPNEVAGIER
ncbi:hypothetical protein ACVWYJ_006936 [Bradyrhizobium sp. USDA 4471]